tara:strand:- start:990 stop:1274 length:285 start_codon:yes stop_codon:yes gene_type:complete
MKITFIKPELFVQHNRNIGIVLFSREQDQHVNFFTGDMEHRRVNRNELGSPSMNYLEAELLTNESLKLLAIDNNIITINYQQSLDFLEYAVSYN